MRALRDLELLAPIVARAEHHRFLDMMAPSGERLSLTPTSR
jgi:hypothetical protein